MCPQNLISLLTHAPAIALALLLRSFAQSFRLTRNCRFEANRLQKQGWQRYEQNQWPEAEQCFQQALVLRRASGDVVGMTEILRILGLMAYEQNAWAEAIYYYQQAFKASNVIHHLEGMGISASNIGWIYRQLGRSAWAMTAYQEALKIYVETDDFFTVGQTMHHLAMIYADLKQPKSAEQYSALANHILQEALNPIEVDMEREGQTSVQPETSRHEAAPQQNSVLGDRSLIDLSTLSMYKPLRPMPAFTDPDPEQLETYKSLDDLRQEATSLHAVAVLYQRDGLYLSALAHEEQALALFQLLGDQVEIDQTFYNLGRIYERLGHRKTAMQCYGRVLGNLFAESSDLSKC